MSSHDLLQHTYAKATRQAALANLTVESVQKAKPFPMPTLKHTDLDHVESPRRRKGKAKVQSRGVPTRRDGVSPGLFAGAARQASHALPYNADLTERVSNYASYPYSAVGKMFFFAGNGSSYVGSAWLVGPRAIITAGHCLYSREDEDFYSNMTFSPAYNGRSTGQPKFQLDESVVDPRYANASRDHCLKWDFGAATLTEDLSQQFGYLGYDSTGEFEELTEVEAVGYPAESRPIHPSKNAGETDPESYPFDGSQMWHSLGAFLGVDNDVCGAANEMTGGCSGGPWIKESTAVGLNSHRYVPHDNRMFSPIFDEDFMALIEWLDDRGAL